MSVKLLDCVKPFFLLLLLLRTEMTFALQCWGKKEHDQCDTRISVISQ